MRYENVNTGSRRPKGGTGAAWGVVPRSGEAAKQDAETRRRGDAETVSAPTFMAAAVLLAIDAFLNEKEGGVA